MERVAGGILGLAITLGLGALLIVMIPILVQVILAVSAVSIVVMVVAGIVMYIASWFSTTET